MPQEAMVAIATKMNPSLVRLTILGNDIDPYAFGQILSKRAGAPDPWTSGATVGGGC